MRTLLIVLTFPLVPLAAQNTLVAPPGFAQLEGNGSNHWPWQSYVSWPYLHMQEIYDSTNFTSQGVSGPIRISQLSYRADGNPGTWGGGVWPSVRIDLSTAAVDFLAPTLVFAQNHGPDRTTVLAGPVTVQAGTSSAPGPWYVTIPIVPFVYDPSLGGDLVIDIEIQSLLQGTSYPVDHVAGNGTPPALGTRLMTVNSGAPDASSIQFHYAPVTQFTFDPVAAYTTFAPGCVGSAGVPTNLATALPRLGQTMVAVIGNLPAPEVAVLCLGWSNTASALGPLPLDLAGFGAPGCRLHVAPDWPVTLLGTSGAATFPLTIPNQVGWLGARFYTQALVLGAAANQLGAATSDAAAVHVGL